MARKKFSKAAKPAKTAATAEAAPKPAAVQPAQFTLTFAGETFTAALSPGNTWADLESSLKSWIGGKSGHEAAMRYTSGSLGGMVGLTMSRASGAPYSAADAMGFAREFAFKEIYDGKALSSAKNTGRKRKTAEDEPEPEV